MSIQSAIYAKLGQLVSNRIYPSVAPQGAPFPRITYAVVGADHPRHLLGTGGIVKDSIQIDCWGASAGEANDLATNCRNLIDNNRNVLWGTETISQCWVDSQLDSCEQQQDGTSLPIYRSTLFVSIWMQEPAI